MKSLHVFLCDILWIIFQGLLEFAWDPPPRVRQESTSKILDNLYDLWTRVKAPHIYMVTAFDSCVKLPKARLRYQRRRKELRNWPKNVKISYSVGQSWGFMNEFQISYNIWRTNSVKWGFSLWPWPEEKEERLWRPRPHPHNHLHRQFPSQLNHLPVRMLQKRLFRGV